MPNGQGTLETSYDSFVSTYTGTWKDGERNGQGTEIDIWTDGYETTYTGEWANDKQNGQGTRTSFGGHLAEDPPVTLIYTGPWKDGKLHGQGKLSFVWADGITSETGLYINGKEDGIFSYTRRDGTTKNKVYKNGEEVP